MSAAADTTPAQLLRRRYRDGKVDTLCDPAGLPAPWPEAVRLEHLF